MQAITAIMLALTYFAAGFAICAGVPPVVGLLSAQASQAEGSPFTQEQLGDLALATRDYTVGSHDLDALMAAVAQANAEARTPYADASAEQLLDEVPAEYTLDREAVAHLDEVNDVVSRFTMPLVGIALISAFCLMALLRAYGYRAVGSPLMLAGAGVLVLFAVLGLWGLVGFSGFFAGLHTLFFSEGSWMFPADSLLICMYPEAFWMGMGLVWLASSSLLALISLVIGALMRRSAKEQAAARAHGPHPASGSSL